MKYADTLRAEADKLDEKRAALLAELDALDPTDETRAADVAARATEITAEAVKLKADATEKRELADARDALEVERKAAPFHAPNVITKVDTYDYDVRSLSRQPVELRDRTMRVLDDKSVMRWAPEGAAEAIERMVGVVDKNNKGAAEQFLATMRPEYIRGFAKLVTGYRDISPDEARALDEARAWSNGTDGDTVIPELFDPQVLLSNAGAINPFRDIATIKTGTADKWEGLYSAGITASWDGEAAEVSDDDPSFTRPTIVAYKGAEFVPFSVEYQGDAAMIVAQLGGMFADAKNRLESTAFATGNGTTAPKGIITALDANSSSEVTPTTDGAFGIEDLYKLMNTLGPRWRGNSSWVASMNVTNRIRAFGTALGHAYTTDLTGSYGFTPLGRPLYESSDYPAPTTLTTGSQNLLTFGDHSQFYVYDRIGFSVEFIPHLFSTGSGRPTGQRGVYGWWRTGSELMANGSTPPVLLLQNQ